MNPFAYLGRASSPEMAGVGPPDPAKQRLWWEDPVTILFRSRRCWTSHPWFVGMYGSYQPFQHMIAKPSVGILSLSVTGIPWAACSDSASTSMSCVPSLLEGMLFMMMMIMMMMMMPNPTLRCVCTCVRVRVRAYVCEAEQRR